MAVISTHATPMITVIFGRRRVPSFVVVVVVLFVVRVGVRKYHDLFCLISVHNRELVSYIIIMSNLFFCMDLLAIYLAGFFFPFIFLTKRDTVMLLKRFFFYFGLNRSKNDHQMFSL